MERALIRTPASIQTLVDDPAVTDICVNQGARVFYDCGQGMRELNHVDSDAFNEDLIRTWVLSMLTACGKSWDAKHPFIDASLALSTDPRTRHRLHVVFPPVSSEAIFVSLRRLPGFQGMELGVSRWCGSPLFHKVSEVFRAGESVLICGATGSGKTTLAGDLLSALSPHERVIALEDTPELAPAHPHFLRLTSRSPNADGCGEITLRTLLKQTLRMRPDRIILGECRGPEVLDLLQALNTGHHGAMATLHANSARDAVKRLELLCLLAANGSIPLQAIREMVAGGLQWVVFVARSGADRSIRELWSLEGREGDRILMRPISRDGNQESCPKNLPRENPRRSTQPSSSFNGC